jgi:hypothetical protein
VKSFCIYLVLALPLAAGSVRVIQTNSAGDAANFIDPATNKVVLTVKDLEAAHGVTSSPDGTRAYFHRRIRQHGGRGGYQDRQASGQGVFEWTSE